MAEIGTDQTTTRTKIPAILPGESRCDVCVDISGKLEFCCQLSPSMALFTLRLDPASANILFDTDNNDDDHVTNVLDVLLHRKEGWDKELLAETVKTLEMLWNTTREKDQEEEDLQQVRREDQEEVKTIHVHGYLVRMYPRHATDSDPLVLYAWSVRVHVDNNDTVFQAKDRIVDTKLVRVEDDPDAAASMITDKKRKVSGQRDNSRFGKFVGFLLQEFGPEALSRHAVLDVAGGAGSLAFELAVRHEIPTIVVDTKIVKLKLYQQQHLEFRQQCIVQLSTDRRGISPMAKNLINRMRVKDFRQIPCFLESHQVLTPQELISVGAATSMLFSPSPKSNTLPERPLNQAQQELRQVLRNGECSVLLGLHPDQATDPIIDIGLALGIPWVVVPCCVFPNLFKTRILASSGKQVRSYEDICDYIRQRDPAIQETVLAFRGRNRVFYWHPPPPSSSSTLPRPNTHHTPTHDILTNSTNLEQEQQDSTVHQMQGVEISSDNGKG